MNMSKKVIYSLILVVSLFLFTKTVYANCNSYTDKDACVAIEECKWINNSCSVECSKIQRGNTSGVAGMVDQASLKKKCNSYSQCRYMNGACYPKYVADAPCDNNNIRSVLKIIGYVLAIVKVAVPLVIIGIGTFDLYKSVVDKDEKSLQKQVKRLIIKVIIGIAIFFVPTVINALFKLSDRLNIVSTGEYQTCASCLLDPFDDARCSTKDIYE